MLVIEIWLPLFRYADTLHLVGLSIRTKNRTLALSKTRRHKRKSLNGLYHPRYNRIHSECNWNLGEGRASDERFGHVQSVAGSFQEQLWASRCEL